MTDDGVLAEVADLLGSDRRHIVNGSAMAIKAEGVGGRTITTQAMERELPLTWAGNGSELQKQIRN